MKTIVATLLCGVALFAAGPLRRAPGFCLMDTSGQWQDLADYRGKIVLVEFMKTECPHCASFSTVLNGLKVKYGDKLAILAIANPPDNPQTMLQFVKGHNLTYPLLLDQGQAAYSYVRTPSLELPTLYLDRKSTRLNSSHLVISYAVFCLKKKLIGTPGSASTCMTRVG